MKRTTKRPDGTEETVEGSPTEILEYDRLRSEYVEWYEKFISACEECERQGVQTAPFDHLYRPTMYC